MRQVLANMTPVTLHAVVVVVVAFLEELLLALPLDALPLL
jgi:hypothetical protein